MPQILSVLSASFTWWCTLTAPLDGDPRHFLLYGRDSWTGQTTMRCHSSGVEVNQQVSVSFFSKNTGFGADASSNLRLNITLWTNQSPNGFTFNATAPGMPNGSMVHWQLSDPATDLTASAWTGSVPGVSQSLSLGTLSIKPTPPTAP